MNALPSSRFAQWFLVSSFSLVVLPSCGGSSVSNTDSSDRSAVDLAKAYCVAEEERAKRCYPEDPPEDTSECTKDMVCSLRARLRADKWKPLIDCLVARPCDKSDDACFQEVAPQEPESAAGTAYLADCTAKLAACPAGSFSNDHCTPGDIPWKLFDDAMYVALTVCFGASQPCDGVSDCLHAAVDARWASIPECG